MLTSFDGGRLFGQVYGSDPPRVLALHGWRRDHRDFTAVLSGKAASGGTGPFKRAPGDQELPGEPLAAIALDLPGFGAAPEPEKACGSDSYAEIVAGVLGEMAAPIVVVGHSFGGRVAVKLASLAPEAVGGVLLTGAPLFPANPGAASKAPLKLRLARRLARSGLVGKERLEALRRQYGSEDYANASETMRGVLVQVLAEERQGAYTGDLAGLGCPLELVWGALDTAAPVHVAEQIAATAGSAVNTVICPDVGHLTPFLVPGEIRAGIDRLLEELDRP